MVGSKRGHAKSLALKTKDLRHQDGGTLKMDKIEPSISVENASLTIRLRNTSPQHTRTAAATVANIEGDYPLGSVSSSIQIHCLFALLATKLYTSSTSACESQHSDTTGRAVGQRHKEEYCQLKHSLTKMIAIRGTRNVPDLNIVYPKMANFV